MSAFRARYIDVTLVESTPSVVRVRTEDDVVLTMDVGIFQALYVPVLDGGVSEIGGSI